VIDKVNKLIKGMNEEAYNNGWKLDASQGTVAFGSALYNWAISVPFMKRAKSRSKRYTRSADQEI
jgi:elongation factor 2